LPEAYVVLCIELSLDDMAVLYAVASRKNMKVKDYILSVLREDISRSLQAPRGEAGG